MFLSFWNWKSLVCVFPFIIHFIMERFLLPDRDRILMHVVIIRLVDHLTMKHCVHQNPNLLDNYSHICNKDRIASVLWYVLGPLFRFNVFDLRSFPFRWKITYHLDIYGHIVMQMYCLNIGSNYSYTLSAHLLWRKLQP